MTDGERALYVESAHSGHMKVEHDTVWFVVLDRAQKLRPRRERLDCEAGGGNESCQGNAYVCVVIHYSQQRHVVYHRCRTVSGGGGRYNWTLVQVSDAGL